MILQPCNVELTKIHYFGQSRNETIETNLAISTISREACDNNFNKNIIIKKNVFGHKWVLSINEGPKESKRKSRLRLVVYVLVFCSIVVAVGFGIFFSVYKNRYKPPNLKKGYLKPVINTTDLNSTFVYKTQEDHRSQLISKPPASTIFSEKMTTSVYINLSSTTNPICGICSVDREVCLKIHETATPKCEKIRDRNDPTGCGGLCPINTHFCQTLDSKGKVYQCSVNKKTLACPADTFNCGNMCISERKRCDGVVHCSNASDEQNCDCNLETHFHCGNSTSCLEKEKKCDHKVDCWDSSDETDCTKASSCNEEEISCISGQCVSKEKLCDGNFDCWDGTDEPEGCQIWI